VAERTQRSIVTTEQRTPNGEGYTSRLVQFLGRDPTADLNSHGQQLEERFRRGIEEAERASQAGQAVLGRWRGGAVRGYATGGAVREQVQE
jgi:hypothetical protein